MITEADLVADLVISLKGIRSIEEAMFACRPSIETVKDGDWVWRFAKGYTGRANSLQSLNIEDYSHVEKRLAMHVRRSLDYAIVPRFRVTPLAAPEIISVLDAQNWTRAGNTLVMVKALAGDAPEVEMAQEISLVNPASSQWQNSILPLLELDADIAAIYREMMEKLPKSAGGFLMTDANDLVRCGVLTGVANGVGGVFSLTTHPKFRRKGLGRAMMTHVLSWLHNKGAKQVALQVETRNKAAILLYRSLGFETAYSYHYRLLEEKKP